MKKFILAFLFFAASLPCFAGSFTDSRDGQTYKTVKIGSLTWMAQNLNYETGESWCYDNKDANCKKYGRLYTWAAAVGKSEQQCSHKERCNFQDQVQGACPEGWHLPSKGEFEMLRDDVGDEVGKKLKSKSGWNNGGNGTDSFGFSALPAGVGGDDGFGRKGERAHFWSSTEPKNLGHKAVVLSLDYDSESGFTGNTKKSPNFGLSVRCVKNSNTGVESSNEPATKSFTDPRDGQTYKTVKIGSQTWMAQNLNYKTKNSWCYDNENAYCEKYGRLYTWAAAVGKSERQCGYGKICNLRNRVQGVCPAGWHLPSWDEFEKLRNAVGAKYFGGRKLKSKSGWNNDGNGTDPFGFSALPAGFRFGVEGDVGFSDEGGGAAFWSSEEIGTHACYLTLDGDGDEEEVYMIDRPKHFAFSVRCLKN